MTISKINSQEPHISVVADTVWSVRPDYVEIKFKRCFHWPQAEGILLSCFIYKSRVRLPHDTHHLDEKVSVAESALSAQ